MDELYLIYLIYYARFIYGWLLCVLQYTTFLVAYREVMLAVGYSLGECTFRNYISRAFLIKHIGEYVCLCAD